MPDLRFAVEGAEAVPFAAAPLIALKLRIENRPAAESIHSILLRCQIQIDAPFRGYQTREEQGLKDLFGERDRWGKTLKKLLWMNLGATVTGFAGATLVDLQLPCTYDLNVASAKYFHALESGDVPLVLLFSGTVFYQGAEGELQVAQVPWSKETSFKLPVRVWQEVREQYFPNLGFLLLRRDVLDRIHRYRIARGMTTFEQALESLLPLDAAPARSGGDA